jgi:hypothetical protein
MWLVRHSSSQSVTLWLINHLRHIFQSSDDIPVSFYGVYDGHAGRDAAAFSASHLHGKIIESPFYPEDPVSSPWSRESQTL